MESVAAFRAGLVGKLTLVVRVWADAQTSRTAGGWIFTEQCRMGGPDIASFSFGTSGSGCLGIAGSIWDVFYSVTAVIWDASEIVVFIILQLRLVILSIVALVLVALAFPHCHCGTVDCWE